MSSFLLLILLNNLICRMEEKDSEFVGIDIGARYIHVAQSKLTADGGRRIVDNFYDPQLNENVRYTQFDVNRIEIFLM